jgi:hypothetical protein
MKTTPYKVVFYCKTDAPSNGHNEYRKDHVFPCTIETHEVNTIIVRDPSDNLNNIYEFIKIQVLPNETYNVHPEIHVTICKNVHTTKMLRGFVYMNGQEYIVEQYAPFRSLQVENSCYDNIIVIWVGGELRSP